MSLDPKPARTLDPEARVKRLEAELLAVRGELTARKTLLQSVEQIARERQTRSDEHRQRVATLEHEIANLRALLTAQPDLAASGSNPLLHYIQVGTKDGLNPHPLFALPKAVA